MQSTVIHSRNVMRDQIVRIEANRSPSELPSAKRLRQRAHANAWSTAQSQGASECSSKAHRPWFSIVIPVRTLIYWQYAVCILMIMYWEYTDNLFWELRLLFLDDIHWDLLIFTCNVGEAHQIPAENSSSSTTCAGNFSTAWYHSQMPFRQMTKRWLALLWVHIPLESWIKTHSFVTVTVFVNFWEDQGSPQSGRRRVTPKLWNGISVWNV